MDNELLLILIYFCGIIQGFVFAYIKYAPETVFKKAFIEGLTLKPLRDLFVKK